MAENKPDQSKKMSKQQLLDYATALVALICASYQDGDWVSLTHNVTAGPEEAPVHFIAFLPGTTKENAIRIQNHFLSEGEKANNPK